MSFDFDAQRSVILIENTVCSCISLLASLILILVHFCKSAEQRTFARRLMLRLMFSTGVFALSNLFAFYDGYENYDEAICEVGAALKSAGASAMSYWFIYISYATYAQTKDYKEDFGSDLTRVSLIIWSVSIITAVIPLISVLFEDFIYFELSYYKIQCSPEPFYIAMAFLYLPNFIGAGFTVYYYRKTVQYIKSRYNTNTKKLLMLPLIYYVSWTPLWTNDFITLVTGEPNFYIELIKVFLNRTQGLLFGLLYWNLEFKKRNYNKVSKLSMALNQEDKDTSGSSSQEQQQQQQRDICKKYENMDLSVTY